MIMKKNIGITIIGTDREGIVAIFTNFIFKNHGNIEKINQNVIKNLFGMYIEISLTKKIDLIKFDLELKKLAHKNMMEVNIFNETKTHQNIAVMVTKESHCLKMILDADNKKMLRGKICVIIGTSNKLKNEINTKIPFIIIRENQQANAEKKLLQINKKYKIDVIILARYMRILTPNFVWRYPNRIINIHPSLLPSFPGANAYAQAYERGTKIIGVTAHYVTENLDQGPIIIQDSFEVNPNESLTTIKKNGQKLESKILLNAVKMHLENRLEVRWRKVYITNKAQ